MTVVRGEGGGTGGDRPIVPRYFRDKVQRIFGEEGARWLAKLSVSLDACVQQWQLKDCRTADSLSVNFVAFAHSPRYGPVVLKLGVPHLEFYTGLEALRCFAGNGACRLLEVEEDRAAILLERISPGLPLKDEPDLRKRLEVGARLVGTLPRPVSSPHSFPTFEQQMATAFARARQEGRTGKAFLSQLDLAEAFCREISAMGRPGVLLHGDLHHENILQGASGQWKAIDPQGRIGEQCLECGRFLLNEWRWFGGIEDPLHVARCFDPFAAALGESRRTVAMSCFLDCTLSCCWSLEDGAGPEVVGATLARMAALLNHI